MPPPLCSPQRCETGNSVRTTCSHTGSGYRGGRSGEAVCGHSDLPVARGRLAPPAVNSSYTNQWLFAPLSRYFCYFQLFWPILDGGTVFGHFGIFHTAELLFFLAISTAFGRRYFCHFWPFWPFSGSGFWPFWLLLDSGIFIVVGHCGALQWQRR